MQSHRRILLSSACGLALLGWSSVAFAQDRIAVTARPVAVVLYPDQATITRSGSVDLPAGDSLVILRNVPAGILADSVNARGRAAGAVSIGSVDLRPLVEAGEEASRATELRRRIREVEDSIAELEVRLAAQVADQALVERLGAAASEAGKAATPRLADTPAQWAEVRAALREGLSQSGEAARRLRLEKRPLEERLAALNAELRSTTPDAPRRGRPAAQEIAIAVRADAATRFEVDVTYQLRGAGWRPVYEARLDSGAGRLDLRQEAAVRQTTGEDWAGVALTLSTARPSAGVQPPALAPWRVSFQPPPVQAREMMSRGAPATVMMAPAPPPPPDGAASPVMADAVQVAAVVIPTGLSVQYAIPGTTDLRSDGTERRVRIADHGIDSRLAARSVPRLDPRAFLEARFQSPASEPLLPGPVTLHLDGAFIGRADLALMRPGEAVTLPFGADDRIRVAYLPQEARRDSGWTLSGRRATRSSEGLTTVKNLHSRPIEITVLDHMPVSGEGDLTVTMQADPAPTQRDVDDRPGVVAWTATFAPNEERRIRFGWQMTAPEGRAIQGLPN